MMDNEKMNNEKRSLSVDDILAEARERRAKRKALENSILLDEIISENKKEEVTKEEAEIIEEFKADDTAEALEDVLEEIPQEEAEEIIDEAEETVDEAEKLDETEENISETEELDEILELENINDEEALEDLIKLDGEETLEELEEKTEIFEITEEETPKKQKITEIIYEWVGEILIAVAIVSVLFSFFFRVVTVYGTSMQPNFHGDDKLIVSSFIYNLKQGDVIVATDVLEEPIIKRIIAVGGQTVDIDNEKGIVYVDGKALDESAYIKDTQTFALGSNKISFPITIDEGCYFVLGDNRGVSKDSRFVDVGQISSENILGEVKARISPISDFKLYF